MENGGRLGLSGVSRWFIRFITRIIMTRSVIASAPSPINVPGAVNHLSTNSVPRHHSVHQNLSGRHLSRRGFVVEDPALSSIVSLQGTENPAVEWLAKVSGPRWNKDEFPMACPGDPHDLGCPMPGIQVKNHVKRPSRTTFVLQMVDGSPDHICCRSSRFGRRPAEAAGQLTRGEESGDFTRPDDCQRVLRPECIHRRDDSDTELVVAIDSRSSILSSCRKYGWWQNSIFVSEKDTLKPRRDNQAFGWSRDFP
jgi:hypothetical protein